MDSGEMWLGIWRRRRQMVAEGPIDLARLLFYDPECEEEAVYYLQKHTGATIEAIHDAYGHHLLVNGNKLTFGISIKDLEEEINEALG